MTYQSNALENIAEPFKKFSIAIWQLEASFLEHITLIFELNRKSLGIEVLQFLREIKSLK